MMHGFFQRLDEVDSLLIASGHRDDLPAALAPLIQEQASADYLAGRLADKSGSGQLLSRIALLLTISDPLEREFAADTLITAAIRRALSDRSASIPTPQSPRQLRALVQGMAQQDAKLDNARRRLLSLGLRMQPSTRALRPDTFAGIVSRAAEEDGFSAAEDLLYASGLTFGDWNRTDAWWVSEVLSGCLVTICRVDSDRAVRFFRALLEQQLSADPAIDRTSTIWLPTLDIRSADSLREAGVMGLKAAVANMTEPNDVGDALLRSLWSSHWTVVRRVALDAASTPGSARINFANEVVSHLVESEVPYDLEVEFRDLLTTRFSELSAGVQSSFFDWIERGTDEASLPVSLPKANRRAYRDRWQFDWLGVVRSSLPPHWQQVYNEFSTQLSESSERWRRGVRVGFVAQNSPVDRDALLAWEPKALPENLAEALDAIGRAPAAASSGFSEVSREGLVLAIADVLPEVGPRWLREWRRISAITPAAEVVLLAALERSVRKDASWISANELQSLLDASLETLEDDPTALRTLALVTQELSATWIDNTDPTRVVTTISELFRRCSAIQEEISEDASLAALNSPGGIAANLACFTHLRLLDTGHMPEPALERSRKTLTSAIDRLLPDTHAAVGRWFSLLLVHDPEWSTRQQDKVFPPGSTLFRAAWGGHVRYGRLRRKVFDDLASEYGFAVGELAAASDEQFESSETQRSLVDHLMVLAAWSEIPVDEDGILGRFFHDSPESARTHAHDFLAREASSSELEPDTLETMKLILAWRSGNAPVGRELAGIGAWCETTVEADWLLPLLLEASQRTIRFTDGGVILQWLQALHATWQPDALPLVRAICQAAEPWELPEWAESIDFLLVAALEASQESARDVAEIADEVARRGLLQLRETHAEATRLLAIESI